ncbi:ATP-binding protein [Paenibacillus barcinonensis]|nr:ATP-binding protein [Paenibacillus barcinonensis]
MKMVIFPLGCLLVIVSSYILGQSSHPILMLFMGILLVASIWGERRYPAFRVIQWLILGAFHYFSQLNWCNMLYYMLILSTIQNKLKVIETLPISMLLMLQYTVIRLFYVSVMDTYSLLVSVFDLITSVVIVVLYHTSMNSEAEKRRLREKNQFLTLHDPLTGLLNYEGYMEVLHKTMEEERSFLLVLLNVHNFSGYKKASGDPWCSVITGTGSMITNQFPEAYGISRYAGDRFAIVLPQIDHIEERLSSLFNELQGLEISYSISLYPRLSQTLQQFMTVAEDQLLQQQRSQWIKNEEELFRSERLRAVGELAAGMAHEIRNPLTAIRGFLQLSRGQAFNIAPWYEVIMSEVTRVTDLTGEFLQFSKPQVNHMKPEKLAQCLERVMSLTESDAASRGHRITLDMKDESVSVNMDRDKIVQVLINLIRNAFEAMPDPGEVRMDMLKEGDRVLISVSDTGSGIPESSLSSIFNPFFTTKEEGTGLGLALCQKIVQDHNGKITVQSEPGTGSTFTLCLPVESN